MPQETRCLEDVEWMEYAMEQEELLSHLTSMCEMTEAGKIIWTLQEYERLRFFIKNPFVQDLEADASHSFTVEGKCQGRVFVYSIREAIGLPSGMCDIEVTEKTPDTDYSECLSFDHDYEYLTSQRQILERYRGHPFVRFSNLVMKQIKSADFREAISTAHRNSAFSQEPIPDKFARLPLLQRIQKMYEHDDAAAFHRLVLNNNLRKGLGLEE